VISYTLVVLKNGKTGISCARKQQKKVAMDPSFLLIWVDEKKVQDAY